MKVHNILSNALLPVALAISQNLFFVSSHSPVSASFSSCPPSGSFMIYQHSDGGGKGLHLCNPTSNLSSQCIHKNTFTKKCDPSWDDRVSSVQSNEWLTLWSDPNFQGRCITLNPNGEVVNLAGAGFEDIASSVRNGFSSSCENKTPRTRASAWVFDAFSYVNSYQDLKNAFGTDRAAAKKHWLNRGIIEGRQGSRDFSPKCYLDRYSDLQNAFGATNYSRALDNTPDRIRG